MNFREVLAFAFLIWISLLPECLQESTQYYLITIFGLATFIMISKDLLRKKFHLNGLDIFLILWSMVLVYACFSPFSFKISIRHIYIPASLCFLYFFFKESQFSDFKREISILVTSLLLIVFIIGIWEFFSKSNFIYERIIPNPYYRSCMRARKIMSTQWHPAVLATYFLCCLPFCFCCAEDARRDIKVLGMVGILAGIIGIALTVTHTAFIAMCFLVGAYLFNKNRKYFLLGLLCLCIFLIASILLYERAYIFYQFSLFSPVHHFSLWYRKVRLIMALKMFRDFPLTGVGLGNFRYLFDVYANGVVSDYIHKIPDNMYLSLLAETGFLGFASFSIFVFLLIRKGISALKALPPSDKVFLRLLLYGFVAILINMMGYDFLYWRMPLYFFSFYAGVIAGYER